MPQSLNIAICEDEAAETKLLCDILDHSDIKNSYTVFTGADALLASYERDKYDLLLMDIYMKDSMTGIEAISLIREKDADIPVAFITTSKDHALESYRLSAIGYIEKPVSETELNNVLHIAMLKKADAPSLYVKRNGTMEKLAFSDIMYIEQRARQIFIHRKDNTEIVCYEKLSELSGQLPDGLFFLPHKSYAVNLSYVMQIDTDLKCFVMTDNSNIPIKRELTAKARKALENGTFFAASHCIGNPEELREIAAALKEFYGETATYEKVKATVDELDTRLADIQSGKLAADSSLSVTYSVLEDGFPTADTFPAVGSVEIDETNDTITLNTSDALIVRWISDGKLIATTKADDAVLDLNEYADRLGNYVRAEVFGEGGILYTQAFLLNAEDNAAANGGKSEKFFDFGFIDCLFAIFKNWIDILGRKLARVC